ncbi:glyoxylase-like metal-dependent hydrolase (beta-lactamase superfamily II) [Krasilnikovia cinnamomea]|uniref:Glyoxylase-like metal-dependent hydrolase (Beta-lactamase superfamily II) n=1 Tax=Krasilnikovia cinnamomea TaxID=349313 RepID=A0A4V2G799_9ACTN|nr:MBL fold metallo-hydrolase [Krasilnikovia cinnamomea]RZU51756.1 glyoxylase-like metal-dependent hydrolase (beta-lactamase superfamily II) [Krasilnikovia cinnamomea]
METATGVAVTGVAQQDAWRRRVLPPVEQVRPGLWSIPVPIPHNPLRYTLSYAFVTDAGVVVVDPGWDTPQGRAALADGLAAAGAAVADVTGIVATHIHLDHHGLSGWLRETAGAWVAMHPAEARTLPARAWRDEHSANDPAWLRGHGVPEDAVEGLFFAETGIAHLMALAEPDRLIEDGDLLPVPGREVRAVWTPGHTPGHLCLRDTAAGVLLTGDHLLPRISPTIGVHQGRDADPLTAYLESLAKVAAFAGDEALPAHEYRFRRVPARAADLIAHHRERSAEIVAVVDRLVAPTAWTIAAELTWSRGWATLQGLTRRLALAETVAHLHHLAASGTLTPDGETPVHWRR